MGPPLAGENIRSMTLNRCVKMLSNWREDKRDGDSGQYEARACHDESVRASCAIFQKPPSNNIWIFVVEMATIMSMISATAAGRVKSPMRMQTPHRISTTPTNGAMISGIGMPIFRKCPRNRPLENEYSNSAIDKHQSRVIRPLKAKQQRQDKACVRLDEIWLNPPGFPRGEG